MIRRGLLLIGSLMLLTVARSQDSPKLVKHAGVISARAKYDAAVTRARAVHDKQAAEAGRELVAELEAILKDVTKAGDLDIALAIRGMKMAIEEEIKQLPDLKLPAPAIDARRAAEARKAFVGKWAIEFKGYKAVWTCEENGSVVSTVSTGKGVWFLDVQNKCISLHFGGHELEQFPLPITPKMRIHSGKEPGKLSATAERTK